MHKLNGTEVRSYFYQILRQLVAVNCVALALMSLFRLILFWNYAEPGTFIKWNRHFWHALWLGMRFDLSALCYINILPLLFLMLLLLSRRIKTIQLFFNVSKIYFFIFFSFVFILLGIDLGYYGYFQDHINVLIFGFFEDDTMALVRTMWKNYPAVTILLASMGLLYSMYRWLQKKLTPPKLIPSFRQSHWMINSVSLILPLFILSLGARGSLGLFPLSPLHTVISDNAFLNTLSFNAVHSFVRAVQLKSKQNQVWNADAKYYGYSQNIHQAFADYYKIPLDQVPADPTKLMTQVTPPNPWAESVRPHVVVVIMESMGAYWIRFNSEQFNVLGDLKTHFDQDYLFLNMLPATGATIGSLGALLVNSPHRPGGAFLTESQYLQVPFRSSPAQVYKKNGYETSFIYGGNTGWRDVYKFAKHQGFDHVEGEVDIENSIGKKLEKHDWGVFDEDVFSHSLQKLQKSQKPQFLLILTTANHPPYTVPSNYKLKPLTPSDELERKLIGDKKLTAERFKTYQYGNQKLSEFITAIKNSELAERTILSATGDHGFYVIQFDDNQLLQKWSVPFYLYVPKLLRKENIDLKIFGSHHDIMPTMYELSLSGQEYIGLGQSLFNPHKEGVSYHLSRLMLSKRGGAFVHKPDKTLYFEWNNDNFDHLIPTQNPSIELKSLAQDYRSGMSLLDEYFRLEKVRSQVP